MRGPLAPPPAEMLQRRPIVGPLTRMMTNSLTSYPPAYRTGAEGEVIAWNDSPARPTLRQFICSRTGAYTTVPLQ
jgi:hypothetical protein